MTRRRVRSRCMPALSSCSTKRWRCLPQAEMRSCIDLDGVICQLKRPGQDYADLEPVPGAAEKLRALRAAGHTIILQTARHMKTCGGNVGQALARKGPATFAWLARHGI